MGFTAHLGDDDRGHVFQVLDVGEQRVPQRDVGVRRELVERGLDLHLHGLSGKVARFHILPDLQQLIRDLPGVDLGARQRGNDAIRAEKAGGVCVCVCSSVASSSKEPVS